MSARQRIYLARHGETEWNALGRLQGATDIPLEETGRAQARALGESLRGAGIVSVTTSDLARARETGALAAAVLGVSVDEVDPQLRERSFGVFEGLTRAQLEQEYPEEWRRWRAEGKVPPGGEPTEQIVARMRRAIARCFVRGGPMLVVSHGAAMRLLLTSLTDQVIQPIANGAVFRLEAARDRVSGGEEVPGLVTGERPPWTAETWTSEARER